MIMSSPLVLITFVVLITATLLARRRKWTTRLRGCVLPPGPRGWPIVGSLLDFPTGERPWVTLRDWSRIYGDIIFIRVLSTPMLIVSSADVAFDLMEKRSSIYSDRREAAIDALTGWEFNVTFMPYGPQWRSIRRTLHQYFNMTVTPDYHDKQTREIHAFLRRCLERTGKQLEPLCVRQTLATTIMDIVYGHRIQDMDDEYIKLIVEAFDVLIETKTTGKYWIDFIPILRYVPPWVPGATATKYGARWHPVIQEMINKPFDAIKNGVDPNPSMARDLVMKLAQEHDPVRRREKEVSAKYATGIAYSAGADTTYSLIQTFFCGVAMNPEVQRKAKEELDAVVGSERLPTYEDHDSLPYIQAILRECMRWIPVAPLGIPHRLTTDDYYKGFLIPEGTVVMANVWHILHDPQEYPEPERFNPDRFIKDNALNPEVRDPSTLAFGFGRRVCPGRHFAKDNAFLTIASVLHVFDVLPSLDENGKELDPTPQMTTGVVSYPDPLHYMLKPRSEAAKRLIGATAL
ncbi:CyP450 monooxygenase [Cytidiella melzeri]|nr:CyP450 monooxygenase [Cytidiella melzeri]